MAEDPGLEELEAEERGAFETARLLLNRTDTIQALMEAGTEIRSMVGRLTEAQVEELRQLWRVRRAVLEGNVKTDELNGRPVTITQVTEVQTKIGPSLRLEGVFEDSDKAFRSWCPGAYDGPVGRFYRSLAPSDLPVRVMHELITHPKDPHKTLWQIRRLPTPPSTRRNGVPF